MTFEDDMIRLYMPDGRTVHVSCLANGIEWPPPKTLHLYVPVIGAEPEQVFCTRTTVSAITDEQRAGMTNVFRGAEYETVNA